jgi:hypothetical protein
MAHFAKVVDNYVVQVIAVNNDQVDNLPFPESEPIGQAFIASIGLDGNWLECSYNNNFRGRYCGIGYTYDQTADQFIAPKPFPSWILDANNEWKAPIPKPKGYFIWNESTQAWDAYVVPTPEA